MRWWVHQSYLVRKSLPVSQPVWLPPPRLKGRIFEAGVGFIAETSHAPSGSIRVMISVDEPIREIKPDNTLEGWIAYGDTCEFEQIPLYQPPREEVATESPIQPEINAGPPNQPSSSTFHQQQPVPSPASETVRLSEQPSSSPMTRSRTRAQASPQGETTVVTDPAQITADIQLESSQPPPSKGKQVVIGDSSTEDTVGEDSSSSTSSSEDTSSNESEVERENLDDAYEEGEVNISGEDEAIAENILADKRHVPSTSEATLAKPSPVAREEEEPLDYGEYGYSPRDHTVTAEARNASPLNLPPVAPSASPRSSIPPRSVAREIAFSEEPADSLIPATATTSVENTAPSLADMIAPDPLLAERGQPLVVSVPAEGNLPPSSAASSGSIGTSLNATSFEKISAHKLALIRNSILAIVEIFKDPDQWCDLAVALDVLNNASRMAKVDISSLRDALLRFHNSIIAMSSTATMTVPPEILEYRKQLVDLKERISQLAPLVSRHDQEQSSLQDQLKILVNEKSSVLDHITALKQEILQLERQSSEIELNIERVQEKIECSCHSVDSERSELLENEKLIISLEGKLAGIPDHAQLISNARLEHVAPKLVFKKICSNT